MDMESQDFNSILYSKSENIKFLWQEDKKCEVMQSVEPWLTGCRKGAQTMPLFNFIHIIVWLGQGYHNNLKPSDPKLRWCDPK